MKNSLLLLLLLFLVVNYTLSLAQPPDTDYSAIDSRARSTEYNGDLQQLVSELTAGYKNQFEEARAIFVWVSHNISYDYVAYNKNKRKSFRCKGNNCSEKYIKWQNKIIDRTLRKKKAICFGYATLFKKMCDYAGIQSSVISGYTKNQPSQVGRMGSLDHAWNAVHIDGSYYYFDVTWASGYCTEDKSGKLTSFTRKFQEYYWLTPIDKLSRNHYPAEEFWAKLSGLESDYKNAAYIKSSHHPLIEIISPDTGVINAKAGDTIHFKVKYSQAIEHLQINTNLSKSPSMWKYDKDTKVLNERNFKKQDYTDFKYQDGIYTFDYIVEKENIRYIEVLFDYELLMKFNCRQELISK